MNACRSAPKVTDRGRVLYPALQTDADTAIAKVLLASVREGALCDYCIAQLISAAHASGPPDVRNE